MQIIKTHELLTAIKNRSIDTQKAISYVDLLKLTDTLSYEDYLTSRYQWRECKEGNMPNSLDHDWVLISKVTTADNFRCVPEVAEYRKGQWYPLNSSEPVDTSIYTVTHWKEIYDEFQE